MASDEKRREVARKLRNNLKYMLRKEGWYGKDLDSNACGNAAYRNIAASVEDCGNLIDGNYIHIVELLADLIDRPTCQNKQVVYNRTAPIEFRTDNFTCSACGETFCADGDWVNHPIDWAFCPNCGAEVLND